MISTAEYRKKFGAASNSGSSKTKTTPDINAVDAMLLDLKAKLIFLRHQADFEQYEHLLSI